jgi:SepF-like predicted cell division protein (DUF552 family)
MVLIPPSQTLIVISRCEIETKFCADFIEILSKIYDEKYPVIVAFITELTEELKTHQTFTKELKIRVNEVNNELTTF